MTKKDIPKPVLDAHLLWITSRGKEGTQADLSEANLSEADLSGADLYGADLYGADLYGADLFEADLYGANLSRADLYGADLSRANLSEADLSEANLSRANLSEADLSGANLSGANLSGATLTIINSKYVAHLSWQKDGTVCIRIGCVCLPVEEYEREKERLADEKDRAWWDAEGQYIFTFLKEEAYRYDAKNANEVLYPKGPPRISVSFRGGGGKAGVACRISPEMP